MNIQELLEKRDILTDIAAELYGDDYIAKDEFWNSPTEKEMFQVESQLRDLGHEDPEVSDEMNALAQIIFDDLIKRGLVDWDEEEEGEEI
jgi:hypothetical protein